MVVHQVTVTVMISGACDSHHTLSEAVNAQ